jgi:hypothetical protein
MADLASATAAHQTAVGGNTLDNETWAWNHFSEYCKSIGLGDNLFLEDMSRTHRIEIIGGFAVAVRQGQFSQPRDAPKHSLRYPQPCGCGLQGKRTQRPKTGCRAQCCTTFTASTKIVQKGQSKRSTTQSSSRLRSSTHPFLKIHRTSSSVKQWANSQELPTSG